MTQGSTPLRASETPDLRHPIEGGKKGSTHTLIHTILTLCYLNGKSRLPAHFVSNHLPQYYLVVPYCWASAIQYYCLSYCSLESHCHEIRKEICRTDVIKCLEI